MFYAAVVLCGLSGGDPGQWRWIAGPLLLAVGAFTLVRPQAAFEVDNPRYWFRGPREPSRAALRRRRAGGVLMVLAGLFGFVVAPLLWPAGTRRWRPVPIAGR